MIVTEENFEEMRQKCIDEVLKVMKGITPDAYIGGEGSEDGTYVVGTDHSDKILYIVHFDWEEVVEIAEAIEKKSLREWIIEVNAGNYPNGNLPYLDN